MATKYIASPKTIRNVWALVTRYPQLPVRALAVRLSYSASTIQSALHRLRDAGYIQFEDRYRNARTIIVPFITLDRSARR